MSEAKRLVQLNQNRMKRAETFRTLWAVNAEPGSIREDFLKPDYWSHIAFQLEPYHMIEVRADDGTYWGEYLVLSCERTWAKVKELRWHELDHQATDLQELIYKFRGPHCKHSVIRVSDSSVLIEKLPSKEDALKWIAANSKAA